MLNKVIKKFSHHSHVACIVFLSRKAKERKGKGRKAKEGKRKKIISVEVIEFVA